MKNSNCTVEFLKWWLFQYNSSIALCKL